MSGWVDNYNGPVGLMIPIGIGFSRILLGRAETPLNFVPVDYVSNSLIAVIAQSVTQFEENAKQGVKLDQVPIYNFGVDKKTCVKIEGIIRHGVAVCSRHPFENTAWAPSSGITTSIFIYSLFFYCLQLLPGLIIEGVLRILKKKFR